MTQEHKTVFISYRRSVSSFVARAVFQDLRANGYDVFMDVENIDSGTFDTIILRQIEARAHFIVILAPGTVERCVEQDDWLRREIEHAMDTQRNIVPLLVSGFSFNGTEPYLTGKLAELPRFNGLNVSHDFFEEAMERLRKRYLKQVVYGTLVPVPAADQLVVQQKIAQAAAPDVSDILPPPFEWVHIPGGVVKLQDASDYGGTEGGAYRIASFEIAKYPVTNGQYQSFVDAPDGYANPHWWDYSDDAKMWRAANPQPRERTSPQEDHPRANVTWFEGVAFCRWLTAKITPVGVHSHAPLPITLPTEQQWQRAAIGDTGWKYPWGNKWDASRCNNSVGAGSSGTMSVQEHPQGASPYRVMDMSGNVWEWCLTEWGSDSHHLSGSKERVLRGGAWFFYNVGNFRAATRLRLFPGGGFGFDGGGFRLAR